MNRSLEHTRAAALLIPPRQTLTHISHPLQREPVCLICQLFLILTPRSMVRAPSGMCGALLLHLRHSHHMRIKLHNLPDTLERVTHVSLPPPPPTPLSFSQPQVWQQPWFDPQVPHDALSSLLPRECWRNCECETHIRNLSPYHRSRLTSFLHRSYPPSLPPATSSS